MNSMKVLDVINETIAKLLRNKFIDATPDVIIAWSRCLVDRRHDLSHIRRACDEALPMDLLRYEVLGKIDSLCRKYKHEELEAERRKEAKKALEDMPPMPEKTVQEITDEQWLNREIRGIKAKILFAKKLDVNVRDSMTPDEIKIAEKYRLFQGTTDEDTVAAFN